MCAFFPLILLALIVGQQYCTLLYSEYNYDNALFSTELTLVNMLELRTLFERSRSKDPARTWQSVSDGGRWMGDMREVFGVEGCHLTIDYHASTNTCRSMVRLFCMIAPDYNNYI